ENGEPVRTPYDWGLSAMFRDLNDDRAPDLYVCNDFQSSTAIVDPDAIGRLKIIADVEVGSTVVVQIAEHCGQTPVIRRADGFAVFVEEGPVGPAHWREPAVANVAEEDVRFPILQHTA